VTNAALDAVRRPEGMKQKNSQFRAVPPGSAMRSASDNQRDSETLRYEVENLTGLTNLLEQEWGALDVALKNASIESFAIRCRSLLFFLYGHLGKLGMDGDEDKLTIRHSDVIGIDFHPGWANECQSSPIWALKVKRDADKQIAHITVARRDLNQTGTGVVNKWEFSSITDDLCRELEKYFKHAPKDNFSAYAMNVMQSCVEARLAPVRTCLLQVGKIADTARSLSSSSGIILTACTTPAPESMVHVFSSGGLTS